MSVFVANCPSFVCLFVFVVVGFISLLFPEGFFFFFFWWSFVCVYCFLSGRLFASCVQACVNP